jgi:hypothetical protein
MSSTDKLEITCPCCQATLLVDAETGLVLNAHEKKSGYSFEDALQQVKHRKEKADELFQKAVEDEKKRQSSLEDKFRKALELKDQLEEPSRPWDMD